MEGVIALYIVMLAAFTGYEVIARVPVNLDANLVSNPDGAGIANTTLTMPKPISIDVQHIPAPCTTDQQATGTCPATAIIGSAVATSPLLKAPLTGNVYSLKSTSSLPRVLVALRGAINTANADPNNDAFVVSLPATGTVDTYRMNMATGPEDTNISGDFDIQRDITIVGGGAQETIIEGGNNDRVFHVINGRLALHDVTIQGGSAPGQTGGGINTIRPIKLLRTRIRSNAAAVGGGLGASGSNDVAATAAKVNLSSRLIPNFVEQVRFSTSPDYVGTTPEPADWQARPRSS